MGTKVGKSPEGTRHKRRHKAQGTRYKPRHKAQDKREGTRLKKERRTKK